MRSTYHSLTGRGFVDQGLSQCDGDGTGHFANGHAARLVLQGDDALVGSVFGRLRALETSAFSACLAEWHRLAAVMHARCVALDAGEENLLGLHDGFIVTRYNPFDRNELAEMRFTVFQCRSKNMRSIPNFVNAVIRLKVLDAHGDFSLVVEASLGKGAVLTSKFLCRDIAQN